MTETRPQTSGIVPGVVVTWCAPRGYGFVKTSTGIGVFVHVSRSPNQQPLPIGTRVQLVYEHTDKGPRAVWCEVLPV